MARRGWICGYLMIAGFASADYAVAQSKLELKFLPGKIVRQQLLQTTKIDVTPPGKKDVFTSQIDQTWLLESQADQVQDDGSAEVRQHFSQIAMTLQLPAPISKRISVDTARPMASEDQTEKNMQEAVTQVLGLDWLITFQKNGSIRTVALSEKLSNLLVDNPKVGPLKDTFTDSGLRKLAEQSTVTFPAEHVKKGDHWEQSVTNDFPDGKLVTKRLCTFDGTVEGGLSKISVKLEATYLPSKTARIPLELTSNHGSGEVYFDPGVGRVVRSRFQQNLVLRMGSAEQPGTQKILLTTILLPADESAKAKP